jgi:voltage-gated potassium channel
MAGRPAARREAPQELDTFAPRVRSRGELAPFLRRLRWVGIAILALLSFGTLAYAITENVGIWDGFLWALDTIATEGARNRPDTVGGEIVWVLLIILGVGTLLYALVTVVEVLVSGHLRTLLDERREQKAIDSLTGHVIICGYGRVGHQAARDLRAAGERYVVVDELPEHAEEARHVGVRFIEGRGSDDEILVQAGIERARAVIAAVDSDAENVFIALTARQLNREVPIIARASEAETTPKLLHAGATRVISPYKTSGSAMARAALSPQVGGVVDVAPEFRLEEIGVEAGCQADGRHLSDVRGEAIVVAIRRTDGRALTQPADETVLRAGDTLIALGAPHTLERLEGALAGQRTGAEA